MKPLPYKFSFLIVILLIISACEKPVQNFELKDHDPKLVANAILTEDSVPRIHFSRSKDLLDSKRDKSEVSNISAYMNYENETVKLLKTSAYLYQNAMHKIKSGNTYSFEASASGYKTISATVTVPERPTFSTIDTSFKKTTYPGCFDCSPEYYFKTEIKIKDDVNTTDFFQLELILVNQIPGKELESFRSPFRAISSSPFVEFADTNSYLSPTELGGVSEGSSFYFSDLSFSGKNISISLYAESYSFFNGPSYVYNGEEGGKEEAISTIPFLSLRLSRISEDLFYHLKALASNNAIGDMPLTEPVYIPGNIQNGLGVLGAKATSDTIIELEDVLRQIDNIPEEEFYD